MSKDAAKQSLLPNGWATVTIGELYDIIGGGTPPTSVESYWMGDIPWISSADIYGIKDIRPRRKITDEAVQNSATNLVPEGSIIVVTRVGLGKVALAKTPICFSQDSQALVCRSNIVDPEYSLYYLSDAVQIFRHQSRGTTIAGVTKKQLFELPFLLPPLPEQHRIVSKIEDLFTKLDEGVDELKKAKAKLRRYRQAVLQAAFTGELSKNWRESHHDQIDDAGQVLAMVLQERENAWVENCFQKKKTAGIRSISKTDYREPVQPITKGVPDLPEGWVYASIDQLISEPMCNGLSVKGQEQPPGVPALKLNAMTERGFDYSQVRYLPIEIESVRTIVVRENDFFVSRGNGSIGLVARGTDAQKPPCDLIFPDTMIRLRFLNSIGSTGWIQTIWQSLPIRRQIERRVKTTAGIWKISQEQLRNIAIPFPTFEEQEIIVNTAQSILSMVEVLESTVEQELSRSVRVRQSILKQAFSGRLVPQDHNDEPAEQLLERIRNSANNAVQSRRRKSNGDAPNGK
jgi:type I restriction enzyme, S subunit